MAQLMLTITSLLTPGRCHMIFVWGFVIFSIYEIVHCMKLLPDVRPAPVYLYYYKQGAGRNSGEMIPIRKIRTCVSTGFFADIHLDNKKEPFTFDLIREKDQYLIFERVKGAKGDIQEVEPGTPFTKFGYTFILKTYNERK